MTLKQYTQNLFHTTHPLAITMWEFSWLERCWLGAGYEDWGSQTINQVTIHDKLRTFLEICNTTVYGLHYPPGFALTRTRL